MCFDNDGYWDFYESGIVKTRKPKRCEATGREILPGELRFWFAGKFDGDFLSGAVSAEAYVMSHLIHLHELAEGCSWQDSWISWDEMTSYLRDTGRVLPSREKAMRIMQRWYYRQREQRRKNRAMSLARKAVQS